MNKQTRLLPALRLAAVAALALASTAGAVDISKLPPASKQEGVTFDKDIKPLFEASCTRCHGADRPKGGLRLTTLENVLKGGKDGKVIEVGKSEKSGLVISVSQLDPDTAMPPKQRARRGPPGAPGAPGAPAGPGAAGATPAAPGSADAPAGGQRPPQGPPPKPLTPEQVGLVRAWIDQGAK